MREMRSTNCVVRRAQIGDLVGCLRLPFSAPLPVVDRERTKFQQSRCLGMQLQVELPHYSGGKFRPKLAGIHFVVESNHDIIGESHENDVVVWSLPTLRLKPRVEHVMKIDICQNRRCTSAMSVPC